MTLLEVLATVIVAQLLYITLCIGAISKRLIPPTSRTKEHDNT